MSSLPAAPDSVFALIVCSLFPRGSMVDETVSPFDVTLLAPTVAVFVMPTAFTATAAATAVFELTAAPFALVTASVSFSEATVSRPPAPIVSPSAMCATAELSTTFTPMAAAMLNFPSDVLCEGELVLVPPFDPTLEAWLFP